MHFEITFKIKVKMLKSDYKCQEYGGKTVELPSYASSGETNMTSSVIGRRERRKRHIDRHT